MKPNSFEYVRAQSLDEVLAVLSERGDEARILAGGQSLIPSMNMRVAAPEVLIDVSGIADMQGIQILDGVLRIGAMSRQVDVHNSPAVVEHAPLIAKAMPNIAHATIRNRGTFGGSLCNADPASELPACALALEARFNIQSASGSRTVAAGEFFQGTYTTCLAEDEVLVSVDLPVAMPGTWTFFDEVARRAGDYPMAGLAAQAIVHDKHLAGVRLVFFAVAEVAISAPTAEKVLSSAPIAKIDAEMVCKAVADDIVPFDDLTTSGAAKTVIMQTLIRRALVSLAAHGGAS